MSELKNKFENSRHKLSAALKGLEEIVIKRLEENHLQTQIVEANQNESELELKLIEQKTIIDNLNLELNSIQKNMEEIGKENEFLKEKDRVISSKLSNIKTQSVIYVEEIRKDLEKIYNIKKPWQQ